MFLSIVTTTFNNSSTIEKFLLDCSETLDLLKVNDFEVIVIDDGSEVNEAVQTQEICNSFEKVQLVLLTRNFGHHAALLRGLEQAKGKLIFLIDSDLEEKVAWLEHLLIALNDESIDVAYGVQESRRGGFFERASGALFYWMMKKFMGVAIPKNFMTVRLMRRGYVDNLLKHRELNLNLSGLLLITGHKQVPIKFKKERLRRGSYSLGKKVDIFVNAVTSFSEYPLKLVFKLGVFVLISLIIETIILVTRWLFLSGSPDGWLSIFLVVQLFGGLSLLSIGTVGIYLSKIFLEVKGRPRTLDLPGRRDVNG